MGIREIYSIVNNSETTAKATSKHDDSTVMNNTTNSNNGTERPDKEDAEEEEDHLENTFHKSIYQIPESLTNKISMMINAAVHQGPLDDEIDGDLTPKPIPKRRVSKHDSLVSHCLVFLNHLISMLAKCDFFYFYFRINRSITRSTQTKLKDQAQVQKAIQIA